MAHENPGSEPAGKKTVLLGATTNPERVAYEAVGRLQNRGHEVIPIGIRKGDVFGIPIQHGLPVIEGVDTVTLYLGPDKQEPYYDYVLHTLKPRRIIFNPGTENPAFAALANKHQIEAEFACTLVLLRLNQY